MPAATVMTVLVTPMPVATVMMVAMRLTPVRLTPVVSLVTFVVVPLAVLWRMKLSGRFLAGRINLPGDFLTRLGRTEIGGFLPRLWGVEFHGVAVPSVAVVRHAVRRPSLRPGMRTRVVAWLRFAVPPLSIQYI